jgi:predicted Zn-dependent peptidase
MNRVLSFIFVLFLTMAAVAVAQKETPPEGGKPRDFKLPERTSFTLGNGLRVTMVPYGEIPKVTVYAVVRAGKINEAATQVWLSDLTAEMLKEGTRTRTAQELAKDASKIGGSVNVAVGDDRSFVSGDALAEYAPALIGLLGDVLKNPSFPASELARVKNNLLRQLAVSQADPQTMTLEEFRKVMYGDHPYGRLLPTPAMLGGYSIDDVTKFYRANFSAARTHLFIAGVFDGSKVEKTVRETFDDWPRGEAPLVNIPRPSSTRSVHIVDRPNASQSTIYLGLPVNDPSTPDWIPMQVLNALLGGSFTSRITTNIRENKGYTYSPASNVSARYRDAYWIQTADVSTDVTGPALKEIFYEISRLQKEAPSAEELKGIQNNLAGIFVLRNSSPAMIINLLSFMDLHGLPDDFLTSYIGKVFAVTPSQVQELANRYLRQGEIMMVIAGDRKKIQKQVSAFGPLVD